MDTESWQFFKISTIFEVVLSKGDLKEGEMPHGNIPLVSSGESNNGIVDYIDESGDGKAQIFPGECITVDMFCQAYYQPKPFYAVSHGRVNILLPKIKLEKNILLFLCAVINHEKYRFSYGRAVYSNVIKNLEVKLPVTSKKSINWNWIKTYMTNLGVDLPETSNVSKNHSINTDNWKYFNITKLFSELVRGKVSNTDLLEEGNDCLYVGAKRENNGVIKRCLYDENLISKGNCVVFICDGQGSVGYANYMDRDFMATTNLTLGYRSDLNKARGIFIATVASLERPRYSYGRKWHAHLPETRIKLPATAAGEPDWDYMENYIKSLPYGDCI